MNTPINISFTLADVLSVGFYALISVVLIYLVFVLKESYCLLKSINEFYNKNSKDIDEIVNKGSLVVKKTSEIMETVPEQTQALLDDLRKSFPLAKGIITVIKGFTNGFKENA